MADSSQARLAVGMTTALLIDGVIAAALEFQLDGDRVGLRRRLNTLAAKVRMTAKPAGITP